MASVIKKGAKGKEVEKIQTLLNKVKANPKLDVDGDFGAKTEAAVKDFQKRCKLKTDGVVGTNTMACLNAGGPIPEMTLKDQSKILKEVETIKQYNISVLQDYAVMSSAALSMHSKMEKKMPSTMKSATAASKLLDQLITNLKDMIKKQADFEKVKASDPKKAEAILADLLKMEASNDLLRKKGSQLMSQMNGGLDDMKSTLDGMTGAIANIMKGIKKRSDDIEKQLAK